jgi:hypothetical protein
MSENHIVPMPQGFIILRILQIVFALIMVGLTAFLISNSDGFVFSVSSMVAEFSEAVNLDTASRLDLIIPRRPKLT